MALVSSREAIANSLVAMLQGVIDPVTNQPIYPLVKLGMIYNPGNINTWAAVWHFQGQGNPSGSGGNDIQWRVDESVTYIVTTGTGPYELDSTMAEKTKLHIQDVVPPVIRKHFQMPDASNPLVAIQSAYSVLINQADRTEKPQTFPNGHAYALWHLFVTIKQAYNVELVQP